MSVPSSSVPAADARGAALSTRKQTLSGTHRTCTPSETLARLAPLLDDFGITRVANITGLDHIGIHTVVVARPNARSLSVSQGKGATLVLAKVSGIMESVEQWHAEHLQLPLARDSYQERRKRHNVIDVQRLPRFLRPFDPDARLLWTTGRAYSIGESVEVPFEMVHLDLTLPLPEGSGFFPLGSNGLASGNTLHEAVAHAAWEVIERDALALFFRLSPDEQAERRLDLQSVDDELCRSLLDRYDAADVGVAVWDVSSDVGLPVFLCSIVERELNPFRRIGLARGSGCHADRRVALCRALTEAAQSRLTRITGSRDDIQAEDFESIRSVEAIRHHQAHLNVTHRPRRFEAIESQTFDDFERDLDWTASRLQAVGVEDLVVVDLSREEFPVHVVRVLIPGLEGVADVPGYVPGARALARERTAG